MATDGRIGADHPLDGRSLTRERVVRIALDGDAAHLTRRARERNVDAARLARDLVDRGVPVYGRNTGVGALLDQRLNDTGASDHSLRLLRSHAGGASLLVNRAHARALMVVRANQLGAGGAGVHPRLHQSLIDALNAGLAPAIHELGSIGTGDLTSLAELGLALVGEGRWLGTGRPPVPPPIDHGDAIALISSNAATLADAVLSAHELDLVLRGGEAAAGISLLAARANLSVLDDRVQAARPHPGQRTVAKRVRAVVGQDVQSERLQDPLSFRCIPQVQGATLDAVRELDTVLHVELNAAAENPLMDVTRGAALTTGNFHLSRMTLVLDQVRAALVQAASQSVQRVSMLFDGRITGLPSFLAAHTEGSSGAMILEYTANAALDELRAAATPASLSNTVVAQGQENHTSAAPLAARQFRRALEHYTTVVGVELVTSMRALRLARRQPSQPVGRAVYECAAAKLPSVMHDRELSTDVELAVDLLRQGVLAATMESSRPVEPVGTSTHGSIA